MALGERSLLGDEDRHVGDDGVDLAEKVAAESTPMRGEIAEHLGTATSPLVPPGERAVGVDRIVAEEPHRACVTAPISPAAIISRAAWTAGRVAVVGSPPGGQPAAVSGLGDGLGVRGAQAHRLLDPQVLARLEDRDADLTVESSAWSR